MNTELPLVMAFKTREFVSLNYSTIDLSRALKITLAEAVILGILLQEYQVHNSKFPSRSFRNHIQKIREKLTLTLGKRMIMSSGLTGYYGISDKNKRLIYDFMQAYKGSK